MIYTVYMLLCIAFGVLFQSKIGSSKKARIAYCSFGGIGLFLIAALRSDVVGVDSGRYSYLFRYMDNVRLSDISVKFNEEPLFYYLLKILSCISTNQNFMFAAIGASFAISVSYLIYKYSEIPYISFVMLIPMQYFPFTLSGFRQTIALSLVIIAVCFIVKGSWGKAALMFFTAYFFHNSVIIALPLFLFRFVKKKYITRIAFLISFVLIYVYRNQLIKFVVSYIYTDYEIYKNEAGSIATLLMYLGIYAICILLINNSVFQKNTECINLRKSYAAINEKDSAAAERAMYIFLEYMLAFGILIQIFVPLQPTIFRAAMYYQLSSILIVPKSISNIPAKGLRPFAIFLFFVVMGVLYYGFTYYAADANPYFFCWQ